MQHGHVGLNALAACLVKARLKATSLKGSCDQGPSPCPYHHDHYVFCPLLGGTVQEGGMDGTLVYSVLGGIILKGLVGC